MDTYGAQHSAFERFLREAPQECLLCCFEFTGLPAISAVSTLSRTSLDCVSRAELVWLQLGIRHNLMSNLLDFLDSRTYLQKFKDTPHTIPSASPGNFIAPAPREWPRVPIFGRVPNRLFLATVGHEALRWRRLDPLEEARQSLPSIRRNDLKIKRRCTPSESGKQLQYTVKVCSNSIPTAAGTEYLKMLMSYGSSLRSWGLGQKDITNEQGPPQARRRGLTGTTSELRITYPKSCSREFPLVLISNGKIYATNFCPLSRSIPPLQVPVVPKFVEFWPKCLMQGAVSQDPLSASDVPRPGIAGTYGRCDATFATWISVDFEETHNDKSLSKEEQFSNNVALLLHNKIQLQRIDHLAVAGRELGLALKNCWDNNRGAPVPSGAVGILAVSYACTSVWPNLTSCDGVDSKVRDCSVETIGLVAVTQGVCKPDVNHSRSRRKHGGPDVPAAAVGACPTPKCAPITFVSFPMRQTGEGDTENICCIDGYLTCASTDGNDDIPAPITADYSKDYINFMAPARSAKDDVYVAMYKGSVAIGTTLGRVIVTRPPHDVIESSRPLKEQAKMAWREISTYIKSVCVTATMAGESFDIHKNLTLLGGDNKIQEILNDFGFYSIVHLNTISLNDGVLYDIIQVDERSNKVQDVSLLNGTTLNPSAVWLYSTTSDYVKIFQYNFYHQTWQSLVVIRLQDVNARSSLYSLERKTGLLGLCNGIDTRIYFFGVKIFSGARDLVSCQSMSELDHKQPSFPQFRAARERGPQSRASRERGGQSTKSTQEQLSEGNVLRASYLFSQMPTLIKTLTRRRWIAVVRLSIRLLDVVQSAAALSVSPSGVLNGHNHLIYACEFDGVRRLVSIDQVEKLIVWDVWQGQKLSSFSLLSCAPSCGLSTFQKTKVLFEQQQSSSVDDFDEGQNDEDEEDLTEEDDAVPSSTVHEGTNNTDLEMLTERSAPTYRLSMSPVEEPCTISPSSAVVSPSINITSWTDFPDLGGPTSSVTPRAPCSDLNKSETVSWSRIAEKLPVPVAETRTLPTTASLAKDVLSDREIIERVLIKSTEDDEAGQIALAVSESFKEAINKLDGSAKDDELDPDFELAVSLSMEIYQNLSIDALMEKINDLETLRWIKMIEEVSPSREEGKRDRIHSSEINKKLPLTGLVERRHGQSDTAANPQSRSISCLSITPTRLSLFYKHKAMVQSWYFD